MDFTSKDATDRPRFAQANLALALPIEEIKLIWSNSLTNSVKISPKLGSI
jgi:hypothetical protein